MCVGYIITLYNIGHWCRVVTVQILTTSRNLFCNSDEGSYPVGPEYTIVFKSEIQYIAELHI